MKISKFLNSFDASGAPNPLNHLASIPSGRGCMVIGLLCLVTAIQGQSAVCAPRPSGLVAWWSGQNTANDKSGTNNGTLHGGTVYVPGYVGQAFDFDGTSGYVQIPSNSDLNPTGSFSIEGWIYPRQDGTQAIMQKWVNFQNQRSYSFFTQPNRVLAFAIADAAHQLDASFQFFLTPESAFPLNAWSHVAAVYDQPAGARRMYINGQLAAERFDAPITILNGTAPAVFGGGFAGGFPEGLYNGLIDELSFYSRALSSEEIQAIYGADSMGKCSAPIITIQPHSQVGFWGKSVTFSVTAIGDPTLGYQWYKDAMPIAGAFASSLMLTNIQATNAGSYSVLVTNSGGGSLSANGLLTVNPSGVSIALHTAITIDGVVGLTYGVQCSTNLNDSNGWRGIANISLGAPTQLWFDLQPANQPQRFYRVLPGPISIP